MKDLHNHLLYGIDDGSCSLEKSILLLKELQEQGVTEIVVTPHYIIGTSYNSNNKEKLELMKKLQKETSIKLYMANEVYLDNNILDNILKSNISTINNSRYLLVELPLNEKLEYTYDILFNLVKEGIIPVLAHPERYHYLTINDLIEFINLGCLLQGNITSLNGKYGKKAKKNLELLLKKNMIHVLGTDTHHNANINLKEILNKLKKIVNKDIYMDLVYNNFTKIVNDLDIELYPIVNTNSLFKKEKIK